MDEMINLISSYTSELESLDLANQNHITTCLGLILVVIGAIATMAGIAKKGNTSPSIYKSISGLFMTIPVISTLYVAILTMNTRKVAVYRGYLIYLEQEYNKNSDAIRQRLNTSALDFISRNSNQNPVGSVMNSFIVIISIAVILIVFISCISLSRVTFKKSLEASSDRKIKHTRVELLMTLSYLGILVVCITILFVSFIDLYINDVTFSNVIQHILTE